MLRTSTQTSHSARVNLYMECAGTVVRLAQVAPDSIIAKTPIDLAPCDATIVVVVDGREHRSRVRLPEGMSRSSVETPVQQITA